MRHAYPINRDAHAASVAQAHVHDILSEHPKVSDEKRKLLARALVLMANLTASLHDVSLRFHLAYETLRIARLRSLAPVDVLTRRLNFALNLYPSRRLRQLRDWTLAIDLHDRPFYGRRTTEGIRGGPKKHGTNYHFTYATAVLVNPRQRWTLAVVPVTEGRPVHEIVATLLDVVAGAGWPIRGVLMDKGFDSGEVIRLLQSRGLSYIIPTKNLRMGKRKGREPLRAAWFRVPAGTVMGVWWQVGDRVAGLVRTTAAVVESLKGKGVEVLCYGGWGLEEPELDERGSARTAERVRELYRQRFGIETSYRQMNQVRGWTTSVDVGLRLLLMGIALLMRQVWVWLTAELAESLGLSDEEWVKQLPLRRMASKLAEALEVGLDERPWPEQAGWLLA